jgi:uncharacterized damage-inducible protein DinB
MSHPARSVIAELYDYNDWANGRVLHLCDGLADELLDAPREMGFGSLRATLFHILAAERVWLDRWTGRFWKALQIDPAGIPVEQLGTALQEVSRERAALIADEEPAGFQRTVIYADSRGTPHAHRIGDLLLHVANHGTHHRAQVVNMLRRSGVTAPAIDVIVWLWGQE